MREQATVQAKLQGDRGTPTAGCARTGEATGVSRVSWKREFWNVLDVLCYSTVTVAF